MGRKLYPSRTNHGKHNVLKNKLRNALTQNLLNKNKKEKEWEDPLSHPSNINEVTNETIINPDKKIRRYEKSTSKSLHKNQNSATLELRNAN